DAFLGGRACGGEHRIFHRSAAGSIVERPLHQGTDVALVAEVEPAHYQHTQGHCHQGEFDDRRASGIVLERASEGSEDHRVSLKLPMPWPISSNTSSRSEPLLVLKCDGVVAHGSISSVSVT